MADFNFYLNRQGPQGKKGDKGDNGFSPVVKVNTSTPTEFRLEIQNETGTVITDNLKSTQIIDNNGKYVTYNSSTGELIATQLDVATEQALGALYVASEQGVLDGAGDNGAVTPETLQTKLDNQYYTQSQVDALIGQSITPGNGTITLTQGGVTKGSFTTNQSSNTTIALDKGGDIDDTTTSDESTWSSEKNNSTFLKSTSLTSVSNSGIVITDTSAVDPQTGLNVPSVSIGTSNLVKSTDVVSMVKLTQAEYDALVTKDSSTFYIIIG